jgi:hypothetical protein
MQSARPLQNGETDHGLGLSRLTGPSNGTAYGHMGSAPGCSTYSFTMAEANRQVTLSLNVLIDSQKLQTATDNALTAGRARKACAVTIEAFPSRPATTPPRCAASSPRGGSVRV